MSMTTELPTEDAELIARARKLYASERVPAVERQILRELVADYRVAVDLAGEWANGHFVHAADYRRKKLADRVAAWEAGE